MNTEAATIPCSKHPLSAIYSATKRCVSCTEEDAPKVPWSILTRREALTQGHRKYWTGKVCVNGHLKQRYTASGICIGCNSMNSMKYSAALRKALYSTRKGLVPVTSMIHPDDVQLLEAYVGALKLQRGA